MKIEPIVTFCGIKIRQLSAPICFGHKDRRWALLIPSEVLSSCNRSSLHVQKLKTDCYKISALFQRIKEELNTKYESLSLQRALKMLNNMFIIHPSDTKG